MALTDNTQIKTVTDALAAADASFQATLDLTNANSAVSKIKAARQTAYTQAGSSTDSDFDNAASVYQAMRTVEKSLSTTVNPLLAGVVAALDTYFTTQIGTAFRDYFNGRTTNTTVAWDDNFRVLWRRVKSQELIVKLGDITATSGPTWGTTLSNTKAIVLDTALEVRTNSAATIGSAAIIVNLVLSKAAGGSELATLTIPAGSLAGTVVPVISSVSGSTNKFVGVQSLSVSGGTSGDKFEVWVK